MRVQQLSGLWKALVILGVFLALFGIVFTFQGYGFGPTSSPMFDNPTWVYAGASIAILGLVVFLFGLWILTSDVKKSKKISSATNTSMDHA